LIEEKDLTPQRLEKEVNALLHNPSALREMGNRMKELALPGAEERIWAEIVQIVGKH
jgi:UDP-N-acetylglucosamine:LPS N-acetylglucosamine transferase